MSARLVTECGLCGSQGLRTVLSLGSSPPTCNMVPIDQPQATEPHHPLDLLFCDQCGLGQLSVVVEPRLVFPPEYPYQSGNSKALHQDFEELAGQVTARVQGLLKDDLVVDIGANDGTLLSKFEGCRTIGIEPTKQVERIQATDAYRAFFDTRLAKRIRADHGPAKVVTACNVLAHVEDIDGVMEGIGILLADDGVLVAENHDLASVVEGQWDTVYHEHLRFFDPHTFSQLLTKHGLWEGGTTQIPTHGGSFRMMATKQQVWKDPLPPKRRRYDFKAMARNAHEARTAIREFAYDGVYGIGATARATTIINYCGLDVEDILCVCEVAGSDKIGRYVPGTRIPVVDERALFETQRDAVLFSWHLADSIVPKLREKGYTGELIVPLPALRAHEPLVAAA